MKKFNFLTTEGKFLIPTDFEDIGDISGDKFPYKEEKWGIFDLSKRIYEEPIFAGVDNLDKNLLCAANDDNLWGIFDIELKKWLIQPKYPWLKSLFDGKVIFLNNDRWGVMDLSETVLLPAIYESLRINQEGYLVGFAADEYFLISPSLEVLIRSKDQFLGFYSEGMISFNVGGDFTKGYFAQGGKWGLLGTNSKVILEPKYEYVFPPSQGVFSVIEGKGANLFSKTGEKILALECVCLRSPVLGFCAIKLEEGWNFFSLETKKVLNAFFFEEVGNFSTQGIAKVRKK